MEYCPSLRCYAFAPCGCQGEALPIAQVEVAPSDWLCSRCGAAGAHAVVSLDAAAGELKCAQCEGGVASLLQPGLNDLEKGSIVRLSQAFQEAEAMNFLEQLTKEVPWNQHLDMLPKGGLTTQPRLIAYMATDASDPRFVYSYPGLVKPLVPTPLTPAVAKIKAHVEKLLGGVEFNSVHLNLYRDGRDHISWHTDEDIPLYGPTPLIASVSLGQERRFILRLIEDHARTLGCALASGSLLVMEGTTQQFFEHCVPKQSSEPAPRINLTFRQVL